MYRFKERKKKKKNNTYTFNKKIGIDRIAFYFESSLGNHRNYYNLNLGFSDHV